MQMAGHRTRPRYAVGKLLRAWPSRSSSREHVSARARPSFARRANPTPRRDIPYINSQPLLTCAAFPILHYPTAQVSFEDGAAVAMTNDVHRNGVRFLDFPASNPAVRSA